MLARGLQSWVIREPLARCWMCCRQKELDFSRMPRRRSQRSGRAHRPGADSIAAVGQLFIASSGGGRAVAFSRCARGAGAHSFVDGRKRRCAVQRSGSAGEFGRRVGSRAAGKSCENQLPGSAGAGQAEYCRERGGASERSPGQADAVCDTDRSGDGSREVEGPGRCAGTDSNDGAGSDGGSIEHSCGAMRAGVGKD